MSTRHLSAVIVLSFALAVSLTAQSAPKPNQPPPNPSAQSPTATNPTSADDPTASADESSSRQTRTDLTPPKDDAKNHPNSADAVADFEPAPSNVQEFHPWNPVRASKDIDVGDFYFRRKNYKAAQERYKDALIYKDTDAVATYRLAVCEEKLGNKEEAKKYFQQYLKILPAGPYAKESQAALAKLEK